jgi:hypothetical protein
MESRPLEPYHAWQICSRDRVAAERRLPGGSCHRGGPLPAGRRPAVRLNGTSDDPWERVCPELFTRFPQVQFYDYTKDPRRPRHTPPNYYPNFSRDSAANEADCLHLRARGWAHSWRALIAHLSILRDPPPNRDANGHFIALSC